ncbi:MAG TPA: carboxypeptidase regulatory-like domain-containing protein [Puia sp.]
MKKLTLYGCWYAILLLSAGLVPATASPLARPIKGQVTDAKGQPLVNVTIQIKGSSRTTTSDEQGNYSINQKKMTFWYFLPSDTRRGRRPSMPGPSSMCSSNSPTSRWAK